MLTQVSEGKPITSGGDNKDQVQLEKLVDSLDTRMQKALGPFEIFSKKDMSEDGLKNFITMTNPCNWKKVTFKALKCLMSGMTVEEGFRAVFKSLLADMASEGLEVLLSGLPADKQQKIRDKVKSEFKDLPAPWEVGYEPGDVEAAYDRQAQENVDQISSEYSSAMDSKEAIEEELARLNDEKRRLGVDTFVEEDWKEYKKNFDELLEETIAILEVTSSQLQQSQTNLMLARQVLETLQQQLEAADNTLAYQQQIVNNGGTQGPAFFAAKNNRDTLAGQLLNQINMVAAAEDSLRIASQNYSAAEAEHNDVVSSELSEEQYKADVQFRLVQIDEKINTLMERYEKLDEKTTEIREDDKDKIGFADKTVEEQEEIIKQEKEKLSWVNLKGKDTIQQGTYGRAVGSVQKELHAAYAEAILENASVAEISDGLTRLPGAKIFGELFASVNCPSHSFFEIPVDEFLGTFTIASCTGGKNRPFSLPMLKELPDVYDFWNMFTETLTQTLISSLSRLASAIILKTLQILESAICKSFAALGEGISDAGTAALNDGKFPRSMLEIMDDIICGDQNSKDEKLKKYDDMFALAGAAMDSVGYKSKAPDVLQTMSSLGSEKDYLKAMLGEGEESFLKNVSTTLSTVHPEYSDTLGSQSNLDKFLQICGNLMSKDQRDKAQELIADPDIQPFPLDPSICLTNEQAKQYFDDLADIYENQIGDPDIAKDFVAKQKQALRSDTSFISTIIAKSPMGVLQDEADKLFAAPDPDCEIDRSLMKQVAKNEQIKEAKQSMTMGFFSALENAFLDDTIEENPFEFTDSVGVLLLVTADVVGYNYAFHHRIRNNMFFQMLNVLKIWDAEAPFPDTVGLHIREELMSQAIEYDNKSSLALTYYNGLEKEARWHSTLTINETYPVGGYHNNNFNYSFNEKSGIFAEVENNNFIVENNQTTEQLEFVKQFSPSQGDMVYSENDNTGINSYKNYVLKNYIQKIIQNNIANIELPIQQTHNIVAAINKFLFTDFKDSLLSDENNEPSNGFIHGAGDNNDQTITVDDLTYVDPEPGATEYTYDEDAGVLGRSLTNNPRVKFLDPTKHGGWYNWPYVSIMKQEKSGYLAFCDMIVPGMSGCDTDASNFLELKQIEDNMSNNESKITPHEKINESPECVEEIPFDKVASSASLAALEAVVDATIRVYLTHFLINTFAIHGNLAFNQKNYDELLFEYIANKMQTGLTQEYSFFASTYEGYTYWLLFLEQCAQVFNRKVKLGEFEPTQEESAALQMINNAQIAYTYPKRANASFDNAFVVPNNNKRPQNIKELISAAKNDFDAVYAYPAVGGFLVAENTKEWTTKIPDYQRLLDEDEKSTIMYGWGFNFWTQAQMNFAAKVATIAENEEACKVFLKRLIRRQTKFYADKLASQMNPRPLVYDINKFLIGGSQALYGSAPRSGIYDVEVPIDITQGADASETINSYYGNVNNCAGSDMIHPLEKVNLSFDEQQKIRLDGGFYLEKYLRIVSKGDEIEDQPPGIREGNPFAAAARDEQSAKENSRPSDDSLPTGVQNIDEFIEFLKTTDIPEHTNVSDWFGNAQVSPSSEKGYIGSVGIKFGVRLCYVPKDEQFNPSISDAESVVIENSKKEKTFLMPLYGKNKYTIPLVSYEQDILDEKLISFRDADENFNQDIKCFIDHMTQTNEFDLIFNKIFNIKKVGSMLGIYSDINFIPSIGLGSGERRPPDVGLLADLLGQDEVSLPDSDDRSDFFNDCRAVCRRLFASSYKRNDFTPKDEEERMSDLDLLTQKLLRKSFDMVQLGTDVTWLQKLRIKQVQRDKDGNECQNQFGGLLSIKQQD
jgi:hypothetical protein